MVIIVASYDRHSRENVSRKKTKRRMMGHRISLYTSGMFLRVILTIALSSSTLFAGYYGLFQIAEVPTTPRVSAMGGAGTALAGGGFGVYNPATPAFADAPFLSCEFGREPGELSKAGIESSWMFPRWFAGASLQVRSADFFNTNERTDETTMNVSLSSDQIMQATITGGYIVGRLAASSSINFFQERIGDQSWHAFTFSPGVLFQLVPNTITIGASLSHYLRLDTAGSPWYTTPVAWYRSARGFPRYARAGLAWRDTVRRWTMPFTAACDFIYSDVYERFMTPLGAEVWILPSLAARAGVCINHPADIVHFGVGIQLQNMRFDFDYGISHAVSDVEAKWLFGLTYSLQKKKPAPIPVQKPKKADSRAVPVPDIREPTAAVPVLLPVTDSVKNTVLKADTSVNPGPDASARSPDTSSIVPASSGNSISPHAGTTPQPGVPAPVVFPKDTISFPSGVKDTSKTGR
jgi:hypothetical protein